MNHILITGAKGQLGLKIQDFAKFAGDVKFTFYDIDELDITNYSLIEAVFKTINFDVIINCAAYTAVDLAEKEEDKAYMANAIAPKNLAKITKLTNTKFIHISTDYVFDGNKNTPYLENDKTNPTSVYGKTKLDGENEILLENPDAIIIRTSWLYSEYGNNFAKTIIKKSQETSVLKLVYDQVGTPTYAGDLAATLLEIVKQYFSTNIWYSGIYHYSNLGVCSWYDFAIKILKTLNSDIELIPVLSSEFSSVVKRPNYSVLNKAKIIDTYKIKIPYWTDSCEDMIKKFNNQ